MVEVMVVVTVAILCGCSGWNCDGSGGSCHHHLRSEWWRGSGSGSGSGSQDGGGGGGSGCHHHCLRSGWWRVWLKWPGSQWWSVDVIAVIGGGPVTIVTIFIWDSGSVVAVVWGGGWWMSTWQADGHQCWGVQEMKKLTYWVHWCQLS